MEIMMAKKKNETKAPSGMDCWRYIYRKILLPTCLWHTLITFMMMMVSEHDAITVNKAGLIFLFSGAIALSNLWFDAKAMNILLRATLHFVCLIFSFVVIMLFASGSFSNNPSGSLLILMALVVLYLLIAPIPVYLIYKKEKASKPEVEYQSIYRR